jgi:DNA-binding NarL/FixJ family response regulator
VAFGSPYPAAYARWRAAEAELAAGGERGAVAADLAAARAAAAELGARPLLAEIDSLARRGRIGREESAPASTADRLGLTERELDVLRLLAAGASNREIGDSLFISHKTVSVHVSRILAKLDARTRVEAAGAAHRLGLV